MDSMYVQYSSPSKHTAHQLTVLVDSSLVGAAIWVTSLETELLDAHTSKYALLSHTL